MNANSDPRFRHYVTVAKASGWEVSRTSKGHWVFASNDKSKIKIFHSGTPSDINAIFSLRRKLKKNGLDIE